MLLKLEHQVLISHILKDIVSFFLVDSAVHFSYNMLIGCGDITVVLPQLFIFCFVTTKPGLLSNQDYC